MRTRAEAQAEFAAGRAERERRGGEIRRTSNCEPIQRPAGEFALGDDFRAFLGSSRGPRRPRLTGFDGMQAAREAFRKTLPPCCEVCGYFVPVYGRRQSPWSYLDLHHVVQRCDGGDHSLTNLAMLCRNCHRLAHGLLRAKIRMPTHRAEFVPWLRSVIRNPDSLTEGR